MSEPTTVLYIHGFGGTNEAGGTADTVAAALGSEYHVIAPVYDTSKPKQAVELFESLSQGPSRGQIIVGNSLGGFFANYLSLSRRGPALLVNPLLHPGTFLRAQGFTEEALSVYAELEAMSASLPPSHRAVLVGTEDDQVDPATNGCTLSPGAKVVSVKMGHKLTDFETAARLVRELATR